MFWRKKQEEEMHDTLAEAAAEYAVDKEIQDRLKRLEAEERQRAIAAFTIDKFVAVLPDGLHAMRNKLLPYGPVEIRAVKPATSSPNVLEFEIAEPTVYFYWDSRAYPKPAFARFRITVKELEP